jgi:regulator of protease activity HflC (stomatin/prohibitin superfamily)
MRATIKQFKNLIVLVLCILFLFTIVFNLHIIPTGYTGVRVKFGQIQEQPEQSGRLIITMPFADRIHKVNNKQQDFTAKNQIWGETDDKTPVYAKDVTVTYQIAADRSAWIYANVTDYTKNLISESLVASAVKSAMVELGPGAVTNRAKIEPLVQSKLNESLAGKYGPDTVYVCKVIIGDMDFEPAYNQAIQAKSIAAQNQAKAEIENRTAIARAEAEKHIAVRNAEADAEKKRIAAEAEADQVRIIAEAQADANRKIQESLTDDLIEMKKVEAWDGKLPQVMGSGTDTLLGIDLG